MMRNLALITILFFSFQNSFPQSLEVYDGYLGSMPVAFFLNKNVNEISGYYIYRSYGRPIPLKGYVVDSLYRLTEYSTNNGKKENNATAVIIWNRAGRSTGRWNSGSRVLEVSLIARESREQWKMLSTKVDLTHTFSNHEEITYPIEVSMIHPVNENEGVFNVLLSDFFQTGRFYNDAWHYFNNFLIKEYENYLSTFSEDIHEKYSLELNGNVVFVSESFLVYCKSGYAFSGGAHGQPLEEYSVYDLRNLAKVKFDDIFKTGSEYALAEIIRTKDIEKHDINVIRKHLDNFYLTDKGIGFVFNPYDIDCYACGTFEFFINLDEIRHLMK